MTRDQGREARKQALRVQYNQTYCKHLLDALTAAEKRVTELEDLNHKAVRVFTEAEERAEAAEQREAELRERLGCAVEELERRHPLGADPITAAVISDGRRALQAPGEDE